MITELTASTTILREPGQFWADLRAERGLDSKATGLAIVSVFSLAIYGAIMGSSHSFQQALSSAVKLPMLYLLTLIICFPTLHILNLLFGAKHSSRQLFTVLLGTLAITSMLILAFAPVAAFFIMTTKHYQFIKLLNVGILGITAILGVRFFYRGMKELSQDGEADSASREKILRIWILLYAFVGSQLAWTLRPFFGSQEMPFEWVRQVDGNFYTDVFRAVGQMLGG